MNTSTKITPAKIALAKEDMFLKSAGMKFWHKVSLCACITMLGAYCVFSDAWILQLAGVFILGSMFAHAVELQHQALHSLGLKNRKWNEVVGVLIGLPMLVSYTHYRATHLRHHRLLGTPENKEFFDYGDQYGESKVQHLRTWLRRLLMPSHYALFAKNLWYALCNRPFEGEKAEVSQRMRRDYLLMLSMIVLLIAASLLWSNAQIILLLWIVPLTCVAIPVHALIEMPEHYRCDVTSTDVYLNTRTIRSNRFMSWFTNGNNFHVEHHLMPGLPIENLGALHEKISKEIRHLETTYRNFYWTLLRHGKTSSSPSNELG